MNNRRLAIVAGLCIVELWIVGLMMRSLVCSRLHGSAFTSVPAANLPLSFAVTNAAGDDFAKTVETGATPHVVIDGGDATLTIAARTGTTVAVAGPGASVETTADGVRIIRTQTGASRRGLAVTVPPGARLDVENAGSTTMAGLRGDATLQSDDGSIAVSDHRGAIEAQTDNGLVELRDVDAPSVDVRSDNGRISFDGVRADRVIVATDNGLVDVRRSLLRGGKIDTDSGRIGLALDPRSDVTVRARVSSGSVLAQAPLTVVKAGGDDEDDDEAPSTIRIGDGSGKLEVGSDGGSIMVSAGGERS